MMTAAGQTGMDQTTTTTTTHKCCGLNFFSCDLVLSILHAHKIFTARQQGLRFFIQVCRCAVYTIYKPSVWLAFLRVKPGTKRKTLQLVNVGLHFL
jgi:hypothetical protein